MAIIRTAFDTTTSSDLLKKGSLRTMFDDTLRSAKVYYKDLVNDLTTKDYIERDQQIAGLAYPGEIMEGQNIPIQAPTLGDSKTYTQRFFGTGFRMTEQMKRYNKYNLFKRWAKDLAKVQKEAKDVEIATLFNSPTSTTLTAGTGFDSGIAMCSASHTGLDSGTDGDYDNLLSSALSYTALESMRYYFATLKDSLGKLMGGQADTLVYCPTLWPTVRELFGSDKKAWEPTNTVNIAKDMGVKLVEYPRLTSTTTWFALQKGDDGYDVNVFTAQEPIFYEKPAPDTTLDTVIVSKQDFTYGWGDARRVYCGNT